MISFATPNGNVLFLLVAKDGKVQTLVGQPTNRQGVLEWLLQNCSNKDQITKVIKFMDEESEAAKKGVQRRAGSTEKNQTTKAANKK